MRLEKARGRGVWAIATVVAAVALTGCDVNVKDVLNQRSQGPDEFRVIPRKPLQMPVVAADLPTPQPGVESPLEPQPLQDAQEALALDGLTPSGETAGEAALLSAAGATDAPDEIRTTLDNEVFDDDRRVLDRYFGKPDPNENPLDKAAEARRLSQEAQQSTNPDLELLPEPTEPE